MRLKTLAAFAALQALALTGMAHAANFSFYGGTTTLPSYGAHPQPGCFCGTGPADGYTINLSGTWGNAANWNADNQAYSPAQGTFATQGPGAGDFVSIGGEPTGFLNPVEGPAMTGSPGAPVSGYYGQAGGILGYQADGFLVTGANGTIANLTVGGPGTLDLGDLTVTDTATFTSVGDLGVVQYTPGSTSTSGDPKVTGFVAGDLEVEGGSLTTPTLQLVSSTADLDKPATFNIDNVDIDTDTTGVFGVAPGTAASNEIFFAEEIDLNNSTLNAETELDIVGIDPNDYPNGVGPVTLAADTSTITAGDIVVATGDLGMGDGEPGAEAALDLKNSEATATNSVIVGDTGDGFLNASDHSTITDQQAIIGNETGSTGTVDLKGGSVWNNSGYLSVGNNGVGTLTIEDGSEVHNTGPSGNAFIAGLEGSGGSSATVTGDGSLWQTSGFFAVGDVEDGTLTVEDKAQVISGDVMYIGLNDGSIGTLDIESGATVTTNSTGDLGTNSTLVGTDAGAIGDLTISGEGSMLESKGDMSIGYSGDGLATVSDGGELKIDGNFLRVGRNADSIGFLTVEGSQSSVDSDSATIYVGYGGDGTVSIESGASLSFVGTNIGGQAGGVGELTIDGDGSHADLGDTIVGDAGDGTLNVTGGATAQAGDVTVGAQAGDPGTITVSGDSSELDADGDLTIGQEGTGDVEVSDSATLQAASLTVGSADGSSGSLSIDTDGTVTISGDATVADESGSEGTVTVGETGAADLEVQGDLTVGGGGSATLTANPGATVTVGGSSLTIGDEATGNGVMTLNGATLSFGGDLTIGGKGTGSLSLQQGASNDLGGTSLAAPSVTIGEESGSHGTLSVDGSNTSFQVSDLTVGKLGQGTVNLSNGALLTVNGDASIADQLSGVVSRVDIDTASQLAVNGDLTVGGGGIATLTIEHAGAANVVGDVTIGDNPNGNGTVTVDGGQNGTTSSIGYGQTLTVGNHGTGTLNVTDGAFVAPTPGGKGAVEIAAAAGSTGTININGKDMTSGKQSELDAKTLAIGGTLTSAGGNGTLNVGTDGKVAVSSQLKVWTGSTVDVAGGGSVTIGSGPAAAAGTVQVDAGGQLGGGGTIDGDLVQTGGIIAPGDPTILNVDGDFIQTGGTLKFVIDGLGDFDQIVATGDVTITGGTIDLEFENGFAPTQGDAFDFLSGAEGINLSGVSFDITGLVNGFQYTAGVDPTTGGFGITALTNGIASSTPEPTAWVLLLTGFIGTGYAVRRRNAERNRLTA